ncbi:MAG TPA: STAS domain-containing protein [Ignavibacteriaceae bacterium]
MLDFEKEYSGDIVIITVNISRATVREAHEFKKFIDDEIKKKKLKIIIDLSPCDFLDSTFIGVLVVTLKKLADIGGELRIIEPPSIAHTILTVTGTLNIFNTHKTKSEAIISLMDPNQIYSSMVS